MLPPNIKSMYQTTNCIKSIYQNYTICLTKILVVCKKTSFSCEITSIERRTIFDLWQMSYAARSSLRSLRYASQKCCGGAFNCWSYFIWLLLSCYYLWILFMELLNWYIHSYYWCLSSY